MKSFLANCPLTNAGLGERTPLTNGPKANNDLSSKSVDLTRGPNALMKTPASSYSQTWPAPQSTLDLDFSNDRGWVRGVGQGRSMDAVTFTRASNGNYVNSAGLLVGGGTGFASNLNLLTFPQNFESAVWTKSNVTIAQNVGVNPVNGLNDAESITVTSSASSQKYIYQGVATLNGTYTFSVYAQYSSQQFLQLSFATDTVPVANFDLVNGTYNVPSGTATASITSVGSGWYRLTMTCTTSTATNPYIFFVSSLAAARQASTTSTGTVNIYGAQLQTGSSATTYYPTNVNVPRFDWASTAQIPYKNLFSSTEMFIGGFWGYTVGSTASISVVSPPSTISTINTVDKLSEDGSTGPHYLGTTSSLFTAGLTYCFSVYAKASERNWLRLSTANQGASGAWFDLTNGVVGSTDSGNISAAITNAGGGWYRCSVVFTATKANPYPVFYICPSNGIYSYTGTSGYGLYIWGAQLELGTSVTSYQAVGAQSTTNTPLVASSSCNGLLVEQASTNNILWCRDGTSNGTNQGVNMFTYSQAFDNAAWSKGNATITAAANIAPDGTTTGAFLLPSTSNVAHYVLEAVSFTGIGTFSFYAKAGGYSYCTLANSPNNYVHFDLTNGSMSSLGSGWGSATCTAVGNGWYRCSATNSTSQSWGGANIYALNAFIANGNTSPSFTGDGTSGIYIWGAQLQPGSYVTNYQPTTSTALAGWGQSNMTVAKTATGIDGVSNAATTLTASSANAIIYQPYVAASAAFASSIYLKAITVTGNIQVTMDGSTWSTVDLSNGLWNRVALAATLVNPVIGVLIQNSGDSVAMDFGQVESSFIAASSPILTTTAAATRPAEISQILNPFFNGFFDQGKGTVVAIFDVVAKNGSVTGEAAASIGTSNNNAYSLLVLADGRSGYGILYPLGNTTYGTAASIPLTQVAVSYINNPGTYSGSINNLGISNLAYPAASSAPLFYDRFGVGMTARSSSTVSQLNGRLKRLIYIPKFANNVTLQDLTGQAT